MGRYTPKYLAGAISAYLHWKENTDPWEKIECTRARMMGKSPDVQFGIRFSTWNVGSMSGKWGEISEISVLIFTVCRK